MWQLPKASWTTEDALRAGVLVAAKAARSVTASIISVNCNCNGNGKNSNGDCN